MSRFLLLTASALAFAATSLPAIADDSMTREDVQAIVKDYLMKNPEVIIDSFKKYQEKQQAEQATKAKTALKEHSKQISDDSISPVAGNPKGDVTVVEFFDYHCGYCKKMLPEMTKLISADPNVRVVFKEFPILSPDSEVAAKASLAVYQLDPSKYFAFHTALMGMNGKFDEATVSEQAEKLGIKSDALKAEMDKKEIGDELKKNRDIAMELGIQGTPAFIIGGSHLIPGYVTFDEIKKSVDESRKSKKTS